MHCCLLCAVVCAAESCDVACSRTLGVPAWGVCAHPGSTDPGQCCDCSPIPHQPVRAGLGVAAWGAAVARHPCGTVASAAWERKALVCVAATLCECALIAEERQRGSIVPGVCWGWGVHVHVHVCGVVVFAFPCACVHGSCRLALVLCAGLFFAVCAGVRTSRPARPRRGAWRRAWGRGTPGATATPPSAARASSGGLGPSGRHPCRGTYRSGLSCLLADMPAAMPAAMLAAVHAALSQQQPHPLPTAARTSVGGGGWVCVPPSVFVGVAPWRPSCGACNANLAPRPALDVARASRPQ
jgi:hypothetical protein